MRKGKHNGRRERERNKRRGGKKTGKCTARACSTVRSRFARTCASRASRHWHAAAVHQEQDEPSCLSNTGTPAGRMFAARLNGATYLQAVDVCVYYCFLSDEISGYLACGHAHVHNDGASGFGQGATKQRPCGLGGARPDTHKHLHRTTE